MNNITFVDFRHALLNSTVTLSALLGDTCGRAYDTLVIQWLYRLYRNGPILHGYGFWSGAESADICASLSKPTGSVFWRNNADECDRLIYKDFMSYVVSFPRPLSFPSPPLTHVLTTRRSYWRPFSTLLFFTSFSVAFSG